MEPCTTPMRLWYARLTASFASRSATSRCSVGSVSCAYTIRRWRCTASASVKLSSGIVTNRHGNSDGSVRWGGLCSAGEPRAICEPSHAPLEVSTSAFAAALLSVLPMVSTRSHNVRVGKATHENGAGSERMRWEAWPCLYCQAMTRTTTCCAPIITTAESRRRLGDVD